jgi:uncharacterized NAD-dependent epimerase/dehydratase family protein
MKMEIKESEKRKIIIHHFDQNAHAMLRFGKNIEILGVYDERKELEGIDAGSFLGMGEIGLRISRDFKELLEKYSKDADMLVTTGEGLYFTDEQRAKEWRKHVIEAMESGLDVYTMSKIFYGERTEDLKKIAKLHGVKLIEASDPYAFDKYEKYALLAKEEGVRTPVVNFTGTSMNSGKITAMLTVRDRMVEKGIKIGVVGTEPSSIFMGVDEQVIPEVLPTMRGAHAILGAVKKIEIEKKPDVILVGNQTGLRSSVTDVKEARAGAIVAWQILLGSQPKKIVLCSKWKNVSEIKPHLELIKNSINVPVVGLVINGFSCEREKLLDIIQSVENEFGILTLDVFATPDKLEGLIKVVAPI